MVPQTMTAVLLTAHGGFDKLEYRTDVPVPQPNPGEVLIEVAAAGINNTDINTRIGWYSKTVTSETLASRATSATVTASKPRSANRRTAVSAIRSRVCCFLRSLRPGWVVTRGL